MARLPAMLSEGEVPRPASQTEKFTTAAHLLTWALIRQFLQSGNLPPHFGTQPPPDVQILHTLRPAANVAQWLTMLVEEQKGIRGDALVPRASAAAPLRCYRSSHCRPHSGSYCGRAPARR